MWWSCDPPFFAKTFLTWRWCTPTQLPPLIRAYTLHRTSGARQVLPLENLDYSGIFHIIYTNSQRASKWYKEVEDRGATRNGTVNGLTEAQTLMTGVPDWDVMRVWSETSLTPPQPMVILRWRTMWLHDTQLTFSSRPSLVALQQMNSEDIMLYVDRLKCTGVDESYEDESQRGEGCADPYNEAKAKAQIRLNLQPRLVTVAKYSGENEVEMESRFRAAFPLAVWFIRRFTAPHPILSKHVLKECCYSPRGPLSTTIGSLMRKPRKLTPLSPRFRGPLPLNNGADIRTWKVGVQSIRILWFNSKTSSVKACV
ncbi:hypothetical protein C8F04DRAFT_1186736 [Mycena alexandri]|uniref:Uncharacterized protein n=1 Tax=Mycena alexandri TaxID=1745969 RepID=A0AAD6SP29_9AGAR|nr:hypothetical protein C8F04DRAFT_1186736 [Mycena alexandri]